MTSNLFKDNTVHHAEFNLKQELYNSKPSFLATISKCLFKVYVEKKISGL